MNAIVLPHTERMGISNPLSILGRAVAYAKEMMERRSAIAELSSLDDRTLHDIGLHRGEIPFIWSRPDFEPGGRFR